MPVEEEREVKISDYYYKKSDIDTQMNNKVDKDGNKVLSDNNYTNADKAKLTNMTPADYVTSSSLSSILSSYVVTSTLNNYYTQDEIQSALSNKADNTTVANKVDKVDGKGLSTNDYTTSEKNKLNGIETGATKTVIDSSLSSTSTNPVQNKVIQSALSNKADNTTVSSKVDKVNGASQMTDSNNYSSFINLPANSTQAEINYNVLRRISDESLYDFIGNVLSIIDTNYDIYQ